jgi:hypothetical protein
MTDEADNKTDKKPKLRRAGRRRETQEKRVEEISREESEEVIM